MQSSVSAFCFDTKLFCRVVYDALFLLVFHFPSALWTPANAGTICVFSFRLHFRIYFDFVYVPCAFLENRS